MSTSTSSRAALDDAVNSDVVVEDCKNSSSSSDPHTTRLWQAVARDAQKAWSTLTTAQRLDINLILHAIHQSPTLPPKSDFERTWPQWLRWDKQIVLAWTKRDDFAELYKERCLFVPHCWTSDKQVMMAYCSKISRSLQDASDELTDDEDVVQAAIALNGLELQYASLRLQETKHIVVQACRQNGRALEFCPPGLLRDELTNDLEFMLQVVKQGGSKMMRLVAEPLKTNQELLLEALAHGLQWRSCPFHLRSDAHFCTQALARNASLYLEMRSDDDLARAACISVTATTPVFERALKHVERLRHDRAVVWNLVTHAEGKFIQDFLLENETYLDDAELVQAAVERHPPLYKHLSVPLKTNQQIMMAAIDADTAIDVVKNMNHVFQAQHIDIVVKAINVGSVRCLRSFQSYLSTDTWQQREVVTAWIRRGMRVAPAMETLIRDDRALGLELAEHAWREFPKVGTTLLADQDFIRDAVDINGRVLRYAAEPLRSDMDMAIRALASHPQALEGSSMDRTQLQTHVKAALDLHNTFVHDFLRGIAAVKLTPPAQQQQAALRKRSHLDMLDRGVETSQAFKKLIGQFLGVPIGTELGRMRRAYRNLTDPPPPPPPPAGNTNDHDIMDLEARMLDRWARRRIHRQQHFGNNNNNNNNANNGAAAAAAPANGDAAAAAPPPQRPGGLLGARIRIRMMRGGAANANDPEQQAPAAAAAAAAAVDAQELPPPLLRPLRPAPPMDPLADDMDFFHFMLAEEMDNAFDADWGIMP